MRSATTASRSRDVARRTITAGIVTASPHAAPEEIVRTTPLFGRRASIFAGVAARDALAGDQRLQHELTGGHGLRRILFRREPGVVNDAQQSRHVLESAMHELRLCVLVYEQRAAFVEPHDDVVDVCAAGALL